MTVRVKDAIGIIYMSSSLEKANEGIQWIEDDDDDEGDDKEEQDDGKAGKKKKATAPYLVKLIDFAHTRMKPGSGPDEGVLKGMQP
ncbi:hypothetical protein C8J56DRAFT_948514 [Mycena floridula]|nr:hypothetical protein C8J56DRAFT_948514 [Mycena floridula]